MALIAEDGTGKADAESYASVTFADAYHDARGNSGWVALTTAEREQALRKATESMLQMYRTKWTGSRTLSTQALDWPRSGVSIDGFALDNDVLPIEVQRACVELALKSTSETLNPDLSQKVIRRKIGPIETEYDRSSPERKRFSVVKDILKPYLNITTGARVIRT